jgi:uncharacterized protein (TIGR03435 family)
VLTLPASVHAQSQSEAQPTPLPIFEVISIKTYPHNYWPTSGSPLRFTADGFVTRNTIAQDLLVYAYDLRDPKLSSRHRLISGGAQWMFWDWYDIQARMSDADIAALNKLTPALQDAYERQLVQSLLADRFQLKVHHVTRDAQAWALVVAKNGPKNMKRVPDTSEGVPAFPDFNHARFQAAPMAALIDLLQVLENVPVLDRTGLTGKYDFNLAFSRDPETPMLPGNTLPPTNDAEPTIFAALQDQLGLKLVPAKISMDEIVIDHIEKPSPN